MTELEEINLCKVQMNGRLSGDTGHSILSLTKLKFINLSNNNIESQIPQGEAWAELSQLEMIEF